MIQCDLVKLILKLDKKIFRRETDRIDRGDTSV